MILKWSIALVLFVGDMPVEKHLLVLDPEKTKTSADCAAAVDALKHEAAKAGMGLWAKCIEVDWVPPAKTKPNDKKSEVTS